MKLSARNQLKGKVININKGAVNSIVSIDIGGGNIITATISCAAVEELGLKVTNDVMMIGIVSRLTNQKGVYLITERLQEILGLDVQLVVLGTGEPNAENAFKLMESN